MSTDVVRTFRRLFPDDDFIESSGTDAESYGGAYSDPPTIRPVRVLEDSVLRAHQVEGRALPTFAAFLDGIQRVRIVAHRRGVPIVLGTVAAVVRTRVERQFIVWPAQPAIVRRAFYFPMSHVRVAERLAEVEVAGFALVDTSKPLKGEQTVSRHPAAIRAVAFDYIGRAREQAERELAEAWCQTPDAGVLCVDGGISHSALVASASCVVGVVKSHQTLHAADEAAIDVVMGLRQGERSSVFALESTARPTVASWYLRVRDPRGRDVLFGLIRVEVAMSDVSSARADEVSRWILAEASPLALPDMRWDRMMYGTWNCEEYLRAIAS